MVVAPSWQTWVTGQGRGPVPPIGAKVRLQGSEEERRCKEKCQVSRRGGHARSPLPSPPPDVPPAPALPSFTPASPQGEKRNIKFPNFQNSVITMSCCCTCFLSTERAAAAHLRLQRRAWSVMINSRRTQWSTSELPVCQGACFPCLSCTASF